MMNQTIQQTTQKFLDLLPENKQYYRIDELRSLGFPSFIVERIQVELERNLAESLILPETDWANTQSDAVTEAWQQFVQAIRAEAHLPSGFAKAVIETAVADTLDMLVEPRKNIPDVIFGSNDELNYEQLRDRIKAVVVYRHFSALVPRYMQKKALETLSRDRCNQIIRRADERLTSNYSPLNWAQTLDPLFRLLDDQVDSSMLRLFFEDKEREKMAGVFDRMDASLSRAEFIESLSSPGWVESQADSEDRILPEESAEESAPPEMAEAGKSEKPIRTGETDTGREEEREGDAQTLNSAFGWEEPALFEPEEEEAEEHTEDEAAAFFSDREETAGNEVEEETEESGTKPIWMNFVSEKEREALESEGERAGETISGLTIEERESRPEMDRNINGDMEKDDDDYGEGPVRELERDDPAEREVEHLKEQLAGGRRRFVEDLFGGSERAYEEALEEIAMLSNWRGASKYIQKEVFQRNLVDMYSEPAIDFTDRLHNYFSKKED